MAHNYNGNPAGITPATAIQVAIPDDGDPDAVSTVNPTAFQRLTDWVKFLFSFVGFMGGAGGGATFTNTGPANGTALTLVGGAGDSIGLASTGKGAGAGVRGVAGGAAATGNAVEGVVGGNGLGYGGYFDVTAGIDNGVDGAAVKAVANNNPAVVAISAGSIPSEATSIANNTGGGTAMRANSNLAGHLGAAFDVADGGLKFSGGVSPVSTAPLHNFLSPSLVVKGWAYVTTTGGVATVQDGQNVGAVSLPAGGGGFMHVLQINWAQAFAGAVYGVMICNAPDGAGVPKNYLISNQGQVAGNVHIGFFDTGLNAPVDPTTNNTGVVVYALGVQ